LPDPANRFRQAEGLYPAASAPAGMTVTAGLSAVIAQVEKGKRK